MKKTTLNPLENARRTTSSGGDPSGPVIASNVTYDNSTSLLIAENVQGAIDEVHQEVEDNGSAISQINENLSQISNSKSDKITYSTNEVNTGDKWIDGKPIYRKTIYREQAISSNAYTDVTLDLNIDTPIRIVNCNGIGAFGDGNFNVTFPRNIPNENEYTVGVLFSTNGITFTASSQGYRYSKIYTTIEYTKTTD